MKTYGFLVGVQIEGDAPNLELITQRLADSVAFIDDVGTVDVESLGEVDVYNEQRVGDEVV